MGNIIRVTVIRPRQRPYRTNNFMPYCNGRQISTRRCHTLFTAIKNWLHRLFGKTRKKLCSRSKQRKKLSRADRKQIEAAIARANRTDKKEKIGTGQYPL